MSSNLIEEKSVCPHCWHKFYADHACYISEHTELYGDPVLGENALRRFSHLEIKSDRDGNPIDPKGWRMRERACPRCHLQIPLDVLTHRPKFVSIVGAPRSGKTYFLTAMLHYLRHELARYFDHTFEVCDYHDQDLFSRYAQKLFSPANPQEPTLLEKTEREGELYNRVLSLDGAEVILPKPFIFSLQPVGSASGRSPKQSSIVLYDNSGESFRFREDDTGKKRFTQHLGESDVVLFAFDLMLHPEARQRLGAISSDPQLTKLKAEPQEDILTSVTQRIRKYRDIPPGKRLDVTLVVCVQKYDVWKTLLPFGSDADGELHLLDHSSIEYVKQHGIAGLDTQEINAISLLLRSLLHGFSANFVKSAEAHFERVRYFPVSALGCSPTEEGDYLMIRPSQIQPYRVTHPMLWMLHEWGLIRSVRPTNENPNSFPAGAIQRVSEGRINVKSPSSGRVLELDAEYAGSSIIDPETGRAMWIPPVPRYDGTPGKKPIAPDRRDVAEKRSEALDLSGHELKRTAKSKKKNKRWWSGWF